MKKVNVLQLRQSLSKVLRLLNSTGEPVLLERARKPAAVLISLEDFEKRFVEVEASLRRQQVVESIKKMARPSSVHESAESIIRRFRNENP